MNTSDAKRRILLNIMITEKMSVKALDILIEMLTEMNEHGLVNQVVRAYRLKTCEYFTIGEIRKLTDYYLPKTYAKMLIHLN